MHAPTPAGSQSLSDLKQLIVDAVEHLDHVLPGQAPILNFVHHNTLHGYQHLPFAEALEAAERLTGIRGYLSDEEFRKFYARGRILDEDLDAALAESPDLDADQAVVSKEGFAATRREIYRVALIHGIEPLSPSQLTWQIEEMTALERFQDDVPPAARHRLVGAAKHASAENGLPQRRVIRDLWDACLSAFGLEHYFLHPEELTDLSVRQAENLLARFRPADGHEQSSPVAHGQMRAEARTELDRLFGRVGDELSLRGLVLELTGQDALDVVRPALIRFCGAHLDEGLAAWHPPDRGRGLFDAWRPLAETDLAFSFGGSGTGGFTPESGDAADCILAELTRLGVPPERFEGYLRRIALELPGWSGLINWRHHRPGYAPNRTAPVSLVDYLALRLAMDRVALERLCRDVWDLPATLPALRSHFERNLSEVLVRRSLFQGRLPEYLACRAEELIADTGSERSGARDRWRVLADMVFTWKHSPMADAQSRHTPGRSAWRLFRLAQHLGLSGDEVRTLAPADCEALLTALDTLSPNRRGYLWLCAYERRYRDQIFQALSANRGRGRWAARERRPEAQVIFCMDDREESIRRHLEELNPAIETLGAAGFFGVPINWRGLDDTAVTPLCPIVVTPANEVREVPRAGAEATRNRHDRRRRLRQWMARVFNQNIRHNLLTSKVLIDVLAPALLPALVAKAFFPSKQERAARRADAVLVPDVPTELALHAPDDGTPATPEEPRMGFTDGEQTDRVAAFLRNTGLTYGFAPLVVLMGHGSISQNNPHLAAYDCGACSGRHGGPNARVFAAMANRPEVRTRLAERGIVIPEDTWFLGSEHNTCDEEILWFDLADLPPNQRPPYKKLVDELETARHHSAHERCRRLASAPREPSLPEALAHIAGRAADFSQARPELGHATNAAAFIGRRSVSQGAFFDRRVFLISYDPTQDGDGRILEGILLAVGPVGAGINLEYYFSTVDNERYGCGTKVPHNVTGLFAVMEGASSDLRTGLPRQMIEIHEAMRLLVVVEHSPEILGAIYERQPPLQELIGNGWIQVASLHPETGAIQRFVPGQGFVPWKSENPAPPEVERSADWYAGHSDPRPPALIRQPAVNPAAGKAAHA